MELESGETTAPSVSRRRAIGAVAAVAGTAVLARVPSAQAATGTSFPEGISVTDDAVTVHEFEFAPRTSSGITFPVPTVRPTGANKNIALDVMPNGKPTNFYGNGLAWIDVCDTDLRTTDGSTGTARIGIYADHVEFGTRGFGISAKPLWLTVGNDGSATPQLKIDGPHSGGPGDLIIGADGSDVVLGTGRGIATSASRGFVYIGATTGAPTGTPQQYGVTNPLVYDRTNKRLWIYDGGWRSAAFT
jgi:hypothetical protein